MASENNFATALLDKLSSVKLTLVLFLVLAAASVIGTLLPQGAGVTELSEQFSPAVASVINLLSLNNLYHSAWFRILLLTLCANLVACTADRLPKTIRLLRISESAFDSKKLSKFGLSGSIASPRPLEETRSIVEQAVGEIFGPVSTVESSGAFCGVCETGKWSRLMVHVVHISVLIILAGALIGSILGFKGSMELVEGGTSDKVALAGGGSVRDLPFSLRCDKFDVSFYDTGAPKEFKSDLTIIEGGRDVLKQSIVVNDPMSYHGITFYQASYGTILKEAEIELTNQESGKKMSIVAPFRRPVAVPGTDEQLAIAEYQENMMRIGQAIELVHWKAGQETSAAWVLVDRPYHGNRIENYLVKVTRLDKAKYSGLEVKKDPGVVVVWTGFILMTLAIGLAFYSSHRKIWICVEPGKKGDRAVVSLAGRSSRDPHGFGERFAALRALIEERLKKNF